MKVRKEAEAAHRAMAENDAKGPLAMRCYLRRKNAKSCRHMVRNNSQNPVTASQAIAKPTMMISGWLKLVRFV